MSGDNLPLVGKLLGHRRHETTAGYAHLADDHLVEAAETVGEKWTPGIGQCGKWNLPRVSGCQIAVSLIEVHRIGGASVQCAVTALGVVETEVAGQSYIVPCRDRVLPGDRIRCTVHGRSGYGFSTDGQKRLIEGEVRHVGNHYWASVRITACPHDRGPSPGSDVFLPMNELLEFDCARMLRDDEEARARLEADVRREIARLDESVARQLLERDRRHGRDIDRGEDYDRSW